MFLSYYGNDGKRLIFGLLDYLGVGISVGFCVVIPLIFFTYLCDGNILIFVSNNNTSTTIFNSRALVTTYFWMLFYRILFQECLLSLLGSVMFMGVCIMTYNSYSHPQYGAPAGKVLACLCGGVSVLLAVNTVLSALTLRK